MSEIAISLKNVSKSYKRYARPVDRLKELILPGKSRAEQFWALQDINLDVPKGETVGIIGRNGSGKSTLLQIIAGTLTPTTGQVIGNGRVSALLELGSGFNPEFTGRQNVFFNGTLLGLTNQEIEAKFDKIAAFAEIGDFIDQPVKTYSSGMFIRLAFAVAISVEPSIFIVDEALAVGDIGFQRKCYQRIESLRDSGTTILMVSHDLNSIKRYSDEVFLLEKGRIYSRGNPNNIAHEYIKLIDSLEEKGIKYTNNNLSEVRQTKSYISEVRYGNKKATIEEFDILDLNGKSCEIINSGETYIIEWNIYFHENIEKPCTGLYLKTINGFDLFSTNTYFEKIPIESQKKGSSMRVRFQMPFPLSPGNYVIGFGLSDMSNDKITPLDRRYDTLCFRVSSISDKTIGMGVLSLNPLIEITNFVNV